MNFQQLRYVRAAVNNDLNLTKVANQVFTSQSGVSKQIKELEAQLQIEIFVRRGKRHQPDRAGPRSRRGDRAAAAGSGQPAHHIAAIRQG